MPGHGRCWTSWPCFASRGSQPEQVAVVFAESGRKGHREWRACAGPCVRAGGGGAYSLASRREHRHALPGDPDLRTGGAMSENTISLPPTSETSVRTARGRKQTAPSDTQGSSV
jgi:hypothetical protein